MKKKLLAALLLTTMAMGLVACGESNIELSEGVYTAELEKDTVSFEILSEGVCKYESFTTQYGYEDTDQYDGTWEATDEKNVYKIVIQGHDFFATLDESGEQMTIQCDTFNRWNGAVFTKE